MSLPIHLHSLSRDIRFWIVLFFLIRMYGITMPPLEVGHNWRQTDGLMIARNFYEHESKILYPTVDLAGEKSGIVGCEFPLLNYLIYLVSLVFGYTHWYGRIIVLIFSSFGILFFYRLIKKNINETSAFNASIILLVSMWFSYSRKIIPDVFAASFCIISLYYALKYFETGKLKFLITFILLGLLGCVVKILAATILTVLLIPVLDTKYSLWRKVIFSFASSIILIAVCWWYFIWVPHLNSISGIPEHFFMGQTFREGLNNILNQWPSVLDRLFMAPIKYTGFVASFVGLVIVIQKKKWMHLAIFLLPLCSFLILLVKTGASIVGDEYYVLTLIPSIAFITGLGLDQMGSKKLVTAVLIIVSIESIADQIYDFRIRQPYKSLENLELTIDSVSNSTDLIAVNGETHSPTVMYFAHRKGWSVPNPLLMDSIYLTDIKKRGCKYVVITKKLNEDVNINYEKVHDSEYFKIYRLE